MKDVYTRRWRTHNTPERRIYTSVAANVLNIGDKVLILLPTDSHKMLMTWNGPYSVVDCIGLADYRVQLETETKVFHINMLKRYYDRLSDGNDSKNVDRGSATNAGVEVEEDQAAAGVLEEDDGDDLELFVPEKQNSDAGSLDEVHICPDMSQKQKDEMWVLLQEYQDIFSNIPDKTDDIEHQIVLTDSNPVRAKIYPVPYSLRDAVKEELS